MAGEKYQYVSPLSRGFVRIPVTRKQHNRMLPNRKKKFGTKIEYYWNAESKIFDAEYFCHWWMKAALTLVMFIPAIVMQGVPETVREVGDLIHERKRGKFICDRFFMREGSEGDLLDFINKATGGNR